MPPFIRLEDDILDLLASPRHQALSRGNELRLDPVRNMAEDDFAEETLSPAAFALWRAAASLRPLREEESAVIAISEFALGACDASLTLSSWSDDPWNAHFSHPTDPKTGGDAWAGSLGESVAFLARQLDAQSRTSRNEALSQC